MQAVIAQASDPALYEPGLIPWAHNKLGTIELMVRRREAAVQHFQRARALMPSYAVIRYGELKLDQADAANDGPP